MAGLKLEKFGGQLPAWEESLLPDPQATVAVNTELTPGTLLGWRKPRLLRALTDPTAKYAYRVPTVTTVTAAAYLVFVLNASEGDTVKLGEQLYTFTATVTADYDVLLGATAMETAENLFAALTEGGTPGTTYGIGTTYNPNIDGTPSNNSVDEVYIGLNSYPRITVIAAESGAAYNATVVAESSANARLTWLHDASSLSNTTTTFRGGANPSFDPAITGTGTWMEFPDADTAVMRSPVVNDQFDRYYIMSPSLPPRYNTYDRILNGDVHWKLGVPDPACTPVVEVTGGGNDVILGFSTTGENGSGQIDANELYMFKVTPDAALQLDDVSLIPTVTDAEVSFCAVLYEDNAGTPGELINQGAFTQGVTSGTQATSPFQNPSGLLANTSYWIGILADKPIYLFTGGPGNGTASVSGAATFANGPPLYAPAVTTGQTDYQMWANLTSSAVLASRAYVYTWVTEYGEEGPPSPFTLVNGWSNGVWSISLFTPPTDDMGVVRNITKTRIYRTVTSQTGLAIYYLVAEIPVLQATYVDEAGDDIVTLNNELESASWFEPPDGLQGLVAMPNGFAAAFRGNEIWFSEPYHPHAWPPGYVLTTEFPIVGLGVVGGTLVVCTSAHPYVVTGQSPGSMSSDKKSLSEPCISRGSIVPGEDAVIYASPNGLIRVSETGTVVNMTESWMTQPRWKEFVPQTGLRAIRLLSDYFCFQCPGQTGFTIEQSSEVNTTSFGPFPATGRHRVGFVQMTAPEDLDVENVLMDPWSGVGFLIQDGSIYYYDFAQAAPEFMTYRWKSKVFTAKYKENYAAMRVFFNIPATTPTQNAYRKEDPTDDASWLEDLPEDRYAYLFVYCDSVLVTVREVRNNREAMRILSGFKGDHWQFEIVSRVEITEVQIATSMKQLRQI
jgi:hypothetical protein